MSDDLMALPLRELLEKFAAGKHKPGSGSAAALLGLISAALSRTVIALTIDRPQYANVRDELQEISREIKDEIQPLLEDAFVQDSKMFDKVIESRKSRDVAVDHAEWWRRSHEALTKLGETDPDLVKLVELRFFTGLSIEETAKAMGVSSRTTKRHWSYARAWLQREMTK
jgi:RNA polymerase sigma factor (sigma-70 family)